MLFSAQAEPAGPAAGIAPVTNHGVADAGHGRRRPWLLAQPTRPRRRLTIKAKAFLLLLTQSLLVVAAFCLLVGWAFNAGFARYTNEFNDQPSKTFAHALQAEYARSGSWDALLRNPTRWAELAMTSAGHPVRDLTELRALFAQFKSDDFPAALGAPLPLRFVLFDGSHHVLIGDPPPHTAFREWNIRDGRGAVVGILGVPQNRPSRYDLQFRRRFLGGLGIMIVGAVLVAILPALFIARLVTRPVNAIGRAARTLAKGETLVPLRVESGDELGELARDFNRLAVALERNQHLQRQWLAEISHELRTPVANLMAEAEAVMDGVRRPGRQCFRSLYDESRRLSRLIDDLQRLSLMDGGMVKLQSATINVAALLAGCVLASQTRFDQKGIDVRATVSQPALTHVIGDQDKLQEVFMNLLENSLRYTDDGGKVRISAEADGDQVRIRYEDSYPGVSEQELAHLFRRLYRGDSSRARASGGAGLGLAIVQSIIKAHDGVIAAAQSPLGGLRFDIRLKGGV